MEDSNLIDVSEKAIKGFFALTSRTFFIKILGVATSFILTIYLDRQSYGIYFVASSLVVFLVYFQDIGLAASLIQKKEAPTREEYATTFTIQQILVLIMVIPALLFSKQIAGFYHMNIQGLWLLQALVVSFFISSLKTIPTVILERQLLFQKLVIPDLVENIVYNLALIILVMNHMGITSFTIAVLARSIIGLFVIYYIQPWKIELRFDIAPLKKLITFGLPFQANSLLALVKDNLVNVYIAKVLPFDQIGLIGFSQKLSFLPSNLVMDNVIRVTFPAYSRLQHDKQALRKVIEASLFLIAACIFP
ncbi:MAG: oligosaccharide flippase family protein, partial [Rhabdochlamydiaceae bacterium]